MNKVRQFYWEVALKNLMLLILIAPFSAKVLLQSMSEMEIHNQSAILSVIGLMMAAAVVGAFEATYQKTNILSLPQRFLAHATKFFLYLGITFLMIIGLSAVGVTELLWDDPLLWAFTAIYTAIFLFDIWDAVISADNQK